jgi:hypothetical protein
MLCAWDPDQHLAWFCPREIGFTFMQVEVERVTQSDISNQEGR